MRLRSPDEQELIDRARGGDADAYTALVRAHQQVAFRVALVIVHSAPDAEEAVQDAFVKAWAALGRFRPGAPFRPWLLTIVAREAHSAGRAGRRRVQWTARAAGEARVLGRAAAGSAEATVLAAEQRSAIHAHVAALVPRDREIIELRYLLDLSEQEIAAVLGVRPGTVKSRLARARGRLRDRIEAEGEP